MAGLVGQDKAPAPDRNVLSRLISIADDPADDDDGRLRRRVGVTAGYLTILAPLSLPLQAQGHPWSLLLAAGMSTFSAVNLVVLARSRRFERYVTALLLAGVAFVPLATWVGGGITGASSGVVFGFLIPAYAIMALGPHRATWWFLAFVVMTVVMVAADPLARDIFGPQPYERQLVGLAMNAVLPLTIIFLLLRYTDLRRRLAEARADELLTNAIPRTIAARLRRGESRIAESYPETTVLFADIVGFTPWAQRTDPARVVALLDALFSSFDELAAVHGVEKIKTIGDSYMAAAGAPEPRGDHALAAFRFAGQMLDAAAKWRQSNDIALELRIGLASGSVVAGVIGQRRILFDLWGDTVNIAARMESSGVAGRVQVAASTWQRLPDKVGFEHREIEVKGLGRMATYLWDEP